MLGFYLSGMAVMDESLFENERFIGREDYKTFTEMDSTIGRAATHFKLTLKDWAAPPEGCRDDEPSMGDTRNAQCSAFQSRLFKRFMIVCMPLWYAILTWVLLFLWAKVLYANAASAARVLKHNELVRVTQPPEAPLDPFSWVSGCHAISVQRQNGEQWTVYTAGNTASPLAGERLAVFMFSVPLVGKRRMGILYAPHMAIVQGV